MATKKHSTRKGITDDEGRNGHESTIDRGGNTELTQQNSAEELTPQSTPALTATGITSVGGSAAGAAIAKSVYDQAKETAGQAYEVAAEKAASKLEEQKTGLSGGLASIADSVRQVGNSLRGSDPQDGISKFTAEYSETAAKKIEDVANYFERRNVREMYGDVENFARRNPAAFVGGAFVLGLLAARFLKSGSRSVDAGTGGADGSSTRG